MMNNHHHYHHHHHHHHKLQNQSAGSTVAGAVIASSGEAVVGNSGGASYETTESYSYLSETEAAILRADAPIFLPDGEQTEEITVNGHKGLWVNRQEIVNWRGPIPITAYEINQDPNPELIRKRTAQQVNYIQEVNSICL